MIYKKRIGGEMMSVKIALDKIEERDVDFTIMQALTEPWFAEVFLSQTKWTGAEVVHIEHSLTDPQYGESDITVIAEKDGKRYGLLIENKIDAIAMQEQYMRYLRRGELGVNNKDYADFEVFLMAPQAYLDTNEEAKKYPHHISYETMRDIFSAHGAVFSAAVLQRAVEKKEGGYIVQEVPSITKFWRALYDYCSQSTYSLEMYEGAGAKGSRSTWPQFRVPLRGTALYYKAKFGVVDLQFSGRKDEGKRLRDDLEELRDTDMHWVETGKSLSLRLKVAKMDFTEDFAAYRDKEIVQMLGAVERLTALATKLNDKGYIV